MILTSTYRDQTTLSRDLLAAFSPLDHPTTATLTAQELTGAFERLMQRLAVLAASARRCRSRGISCRAD